MVDDVKAGTVMMIVVRPPKHTIHSEEYIKRPPILRKIISLSKVQDEEVPAYLRKKYFKKTGQTIKLILEPIQR